MDTIDTDRYGTILNDLRYYSHVYTKMTMEELFDATDEIVSLDDEVHMLKCGLINLLKSRDQEKCIKVLDYLMNTYDMDPHLSSDYIFFVCCDNSSLEVLEYLFKNVIYTEVELRRMKDEYEGDVDACRFSIDIIKLAIRCKVDIQPFINLELFHWCDIDYETLEPIIHCGYHIPPEVFMIYVEDGKTKCVKLLLDSNIASIGVDMHNDDPINTALMNMDSKMIELLKSYGATINSNLNDYININNRQSEWLNTARSLDIPDDQIIRILMTRLNMINDEYGPLSPPVSKMLEKN